jgi:Uma2 family endonuclease
MDQLVATLDEPQETMSRAAYLAWYERQAGGRFECVYGTVVRMAPERVERVDMKYRVWLLLSRALEAMVGWHVHGDGLRVEIDDCDFEPDAIVRRGDPLPRTSTAVPDAVVLVEVVSPDTSRPIGA